jgi:benzoyl-CoA reductase/2-hydroxyglutaryl-CoA dehydratase subunit BcrC/BadD/HgdB
MHHLGSRMYKTHWSIVNLTVLQHAQTMRKDTEGVEINTEKIKHFLCRRIKMRDNTITKDRIKKIFSSI